MNITILCSREIRERGLKARADEYRKRISRWADILVNCYPPFASTRGRKWGETFFRNIRGGPVLIACDSLGKSMTSERFSNELETWGGNGGIFFFIGDDEGIPARVLEMAKHRVSFSEMTFPHELFQVILLEQIYRGLSILNHHPYHRG